MRIGTSFDNKTDQWLGASLAANNENIIVKSRFHLFDMNEKIVFQAGTPFLKHRINDGHNLEYEIPGGALIGKYGSMSSSMTDSTQIFSPSFLNWRMLIVFWIRMKICSMNDFRFSKL